MALNVYRTGRKMTKLLAFDESGNTGTDLLNIKQPIFVLASCDFTVEEAESLLNQIKSVQVINELKFTKLKKSSRGKKRILEFLSDDRLTKDRAKVFYFHKRYLVVTKIVDLLVENLAHRDGIDLYKNGLNIAMSNLHYYSIPAFCGESLFDKLLDAFIKMFQEPTNTTISHFFHTVYTLFEQCSNPEYKQLIAPIMASSEIIIDVLQTNNKTVLDPAITAFFTLCSIWGEQYGETFKILHDQSKPLASERETLEMLMDKNGPYQKIGYDRRAFEFPLRSDCIELGDSKTDPRLQVADLISGSCYHWARGKADIQYQDEFWFQLDHLDMTKLAIGSIWPSPAVTPEEMGTHTGGGNNAVEAITRYVAEKQSN
jgi:hypothetical protein